MIQISKLIQNFEAWAPPSWQEKWDNCGWQIEPGVLDEAAGILVCLTPTLAVMEEAIALKSQGAPVNLIFAHHPLIFGKLTSVCKGDVIGDMVRLAIAHHIGIYTAHTNFDQVDDGTADVLAQQLNLQNTEPVEPTQQGFGYGRVGELPRPLPLQQLLNQIHDRLNPPDLIYSPEADLQKEIRRVAVLGGSGAGYIGAVTQTGAEAYVTSDCKFHQFQAARDRNLTLIDAGHYATERPACAKLTERFLAQGAGWVKLSERDEDFRKFNRSQC